MARREEGTDPLSDWPVDSDRQSEPFDVIPTSAGTRSFSRSGFGYGKPESGSGPLSLSVLNSSVSVAVTS